MGLAVCDRRAAGLAVFFPGAGGCRLCALRRQKPACRGSVLHRCLCLLGMAAWAYFHWFSMEPVWLCMERLAGDGADRLGRRLLFPDAADVVLDRAARLPVHMVCTPAQKDYPP